MTTDVRFRDCGCPGTPHVPGWDPEHPDREGDEVVLRDYLGWDAGAQALRVLTAGITRQEEINEKLGPIYLREGPVGWNLLDGEGEPVEFDPEAMLELPFEQAYIVADQADTLYTERVLSPLLGKMSALSASTPTVGTSRTSRSSRRHLTPVAPSSPATSAAGKRRAG